MALVKIDGREIPLDDAIAGNDELLKQALLPHLPEIANATISRETKDGLLIVTLVKRAGSKGAMPGLAAMMAAPEEVNPVFGVAFWLRWNDARGTLDLHQLQDLQETIDATLAKGEQEEKHTVRSLRWLKEAPAVAQPSHIIVGF